MYIVTWSELRASDCPWGEMKIFSFEIYWPPQVENSILSSRKKIKGRPVSDLGGIRRVPLIVWSQGFNKSASDLGKPLE